MKFFFLVSLLIPAVAFAAGNKPREIVIEAKIVDNATHWTPDKIEVTQGEKLHIIAKHDLPKGFDFHGLSIPALKITRQVNRGKPEIIDVTIPKDMKPGDYDVKCQFHPAHVGAKLVVKAAEPGKT